MNRQDLRLRLKAIFRPKRVEQDLQDELAFHIEMETEKNVSLGLPPDEARRRAILKVGGVPQLAEVCRDERRTGAWEGLLRDLRHAFRLLHRNPGYAATAICVLALGIAASTAIFSAAYAVLLRPLPFPDPDRLVRLWDNYGNPGNLAPVSYPNFRDWRAWNSSFEGLAAFQDFGTVLTGYGEPTPLQGLSVSANFFDVFGVRPALGRTFRAEEEIPGAIDGADSVIISDRLWRGPFAANPAIVGTHILLSGRAFVIVGVMPPGISSDTDLWSTVATAARVRPGMPQPLTEERGIGNWNAIGRLKPGVTIESAGVDMTRVAGLLERNYPADDPSEGVFIESLQKWETGSVRPMLIVLLWSAAAVLLIACADISGLALARVSERQREISVRTAIGASRWRIVHQLLVESLVLALCGAAAGIVLAGLLVRFLTVFLRLESGSVTVAWPALAFAAGAAGFSAIVFSLAPAIHALRLDLLHGLKEAVANVTASTRQRRLQTVLATSQVALATVLLSACGLLALNIVHLESANLGFDAQHVLTFQIALPTVRYSQSDRGRFTGELVANLRAIPGVESASAGTQLPFRSFTPRTVLSNVDGKPIALRDRSGIVYSPITPDYFRTLGIPILMGRPFTDADSAPAPPVVILNQTAARKYFGGADPIGRQVQPEMWNGSGSTTQMRTVVGVAGDVKLNASEQPMESVYWPLQQIPSEGLYWIAVRTAGDPLSVAADARKQLRRMDSEMPFYQASPLTAAVEASLVQPRYNTALVGFFAGLALLLTAAGLYGNIAYAVSQRTREIGIRMALGAGRKRVIRQFASGGLLLGIAGVAIGLAFAKGATRIMQSLVFGASLDEPLSFAVSAAVLLFIVIAACYIPARRAARIDPMRALRND